MANELVASLVIRAQAAQAIRAINETRSTLGSLGSTAKRVGAGLATLGGGAMLGEFFKSSVSAAIASQGESARVATAQINDGVAATRELAEVQRFATETSSKLAISEDALKESYNLARFSGLDHAAAIVASNDAAKLAIGTTRTVAEAQAQAAASTRMLATSYEVFADKSRPARAQIDAIADSYARLQMSSNFANQGELNQALVQAVGVSKAYGVGLAVQNAFLATLANSGKFAGEAGTGYEELISKLSASNKRMAGFAAAAGGDVVRELGMIRAQTEGLGTVQRAAWFAAHGFELRSAQGLAVVLDQYTQITKSVTEFGSASKGANEALFLKRSAAADEQLAVAANNLENLKIALGTGLLPMVANVTTKLVELFRYLTKFADAHPAVATVAMDFLAISAALIAVSGTMQILGVGRTLTMAWAGALKILTAGQWLFNAAMDANPVGLAIVGVAALAAGAYELYEHWTAVKKVLSDVFEPLSTLASYFTTAFDNISASFKNWGREVLGYLAYPFIALPREIAKAAGAITGAAKGIAHGIAKLFVGHSPIPEGPLHDLNLSREIAVSLKPAPMLAAVRRLAAVAAVSIPVAMASPAFAASRVPPLETSAPRQAAAHTSNITVNLAPRMDFRGSGAGLDVDAVRAAVRDELKRSGHELAETLRREQHKRERLEF